MNAALVDSTSAFRQGDPGSNPLAGTEICEVYPGLGILQTVESLPRLLLRHANILQCLALSMDEQYAVWYQHATKVPWLLAQKGFDDQ